MGAECSRKCCKWFSGDKNGAVPETRRSLVGEPRRIQGTEEVEFSFSRSMPPLRTKGTESDTDDSIDSFHSFDEEAMEKAFMVLGRFSTVRRTSLLYNTTPSQKANLSPRKKLPSKNTNHISKYVWLEEVLQIIISGGANNVARIEDTGQKATPLFVVAGACPNSMCGMQAVMYSHLGKSVEFWWIKPSASNKSALERNTMNLHSGGKFKNAAGKAKAVYEPFAEKFSGAVDGDFTFGVDKETGRAFIDEVDESGKKNRMFLYFVWQETWSSVMAKKKFMKGKLFYQKGTDKMFYARQYRIADSKLIILEEETEEEVSTLLPPDPLQELYEMSD